MGRMGCTCGRHMNYIVHFERTTTEKPQTYEERLPWSFEKQLWQFRFHKCIECFNRLNNCQRLKEDDISWNLFRKYNICVYMAYWFCWGHCCFFFQVANAMVANWAGPPAMLAIFRKLFGSFSCPHIVRQNNFTNLQHYFLQKARLFFPQPIS